jgi:hypothetical protein
MIQPHATSVMMATTFPGSIGYTVPIAATAKMSPATMVTTIWVSTALSCHRPVRLSVESHLVCGRRSSLCAHLTISPEGRPTRAVQQAQRWPQR